MKKIILSCCTGLLLFCMGCTEDKLSLEKLVAPQASSETTLGSDTSYVQMKPDWTGFNGPQAVIIGNEPFVYVADTYNDRIVMLDIAGRVLGYSQKIKRPVAIAQDKRLQLLVCAEFDTVLQANGPVTTFGAVYRLNLPEVNHVLSQAVPKRVFFEPADNTRRYTAVGTLFNNAYFVARTGPKNELTMIDRDNAILLFGRNDILITPVTTNFSPDGTGLMSIHSTTALATLPTGRSLDFIFAQVEVPGSSVVPLLKVQWIQLITQGQTTNYASKYPSIDDRIGITQINKFKEPRGIAVDPSGNLFVVDSGTDSLYRFNARGIEQFSFGGANDSHKRFLNDPYSVAFYDNTIFIADKGNNRICRFKLSIDIF
jgi:hypothetical protein